MSEPIVQIWQEADGSKTFVHAHDPSTDSWAFEHVDANGNTDASGELKSGDPDPAGVMVDEDLWETYGKS